MSRRFGNPSPPKMGTEISAPPVASLPAVGDSVGGADGQQPPLSSASPELQPLTLRQMDQMLNPAHSGNANDPRTRFFSAADEEVRPLPQAEILPAPGATGEEAPPAPAMAAQTGLVEVRLEDGKPIMVPPDYADAIKYQVELQKREKGDKDRALAQLAVAQAQLAALQAGQTVAQNQPKPAPAAPQPIVHGQQVAQVLAKAQNFDRENGFGGALAGMIADLASSIRAEVMQDAKAQVFEPVSQYMAEYQDKAAQMQQFLGAQQLSRQVANEVAAYSAKFPPVASVLNPEDIVGQVAQLESYAAQQGISVTRNEIILTAINSRIAEAFAKAGQSAPAPASPPVSAPPQNGRSYSDRTVNAGTLAVPTAQINSQRTNGTHKPQGFRELLGFTQ